MSTLGPATTQFLRSRDPSLAELSEDSARREMVERLRAQDLPDSIAVLSWELVRLVPQLDDKDARGLAYLCALVLADLHHQSTRTPVRGPLALPHLHGVLSAWVPQTQARSLIIQDMQRVLTQARAPTLIGSHPDGDQPLLMDSDTLYVQRILHLEISLAEALRKRLAPSVDLDAAVAAWPHLGHAGQPPGDPGPNDEALRQALLRPLTVVHGGGVEARAHFVLRLVQFWGGAERPEGELTLLAPTRQGVQSLREDLAEQLQALTSAEAQPGAQEGHDPHIQTVEAWLGADPGAARARRTSLLVVHEAAGLSQSQLQAILTHLEAGARLVLVGDAHELGAEDSGAVFRDLVALGPPLSLGLAEAPGPEPSAPSLSVVRAAQAVCAGALPQAEHPEHGLLCVERAQDLPPSGLALLQGEDTPRLAQALIRRWQAQDRTPELSAATFRTYGFDGAAFDPEAVGRLELLLRTLHDRKFVCLVDHPDFDTSAHAMNLLFHRELAGHAGHAGHAGEEIIRVGEPIVMLRDDPARGLGRGDTGVVLNVAVQGAPAVPMLVFKVAGKFSPFLSSSLMSRVTWAYALSVRLTQGMRLRDLVIPLPPQELPQLHRQLLYTAMVRAERSVTFVGSLERLERAVQRTCPRYSGLTERLASARHIEGGET